jgi:hypothetical protein
VAALRERIKEKPFSEGLTQVWRIDDLEGVFGHYVSNYSFPHAILSERQIPLNTDDRPLLEFAFARNLTENGAFDFQSFRRTAMLCHAEYPNTTAGQLDWPKVEISRMETFLAEDEDAIGSAPADPEAQKLHGVLRSYSEGRFAEAWASWGELHREPQTMLELLMVTECLADNGDENALRYVAKMRELHMPEADALTARYLWRAERTDEAVKTLEKTFADFRTNPWHSNSVAERTMNMAAAIATGDDNPKIAIRLYNALKEPFAVYNGEGIRNDVLLRIAAMLDQAGQSKYCLAEIAKAEPFVPWNFEFLRLRETVYTAAHHPLADVARQDVEVFLQREGGLRRKPQPAGQVRRVASTDE